MTNLICPACNIELNNSEYGEGSGCLQCLQCKIRIFYDKDYPNGFSLCLEDEQDFYIKFHNENEVYIYFQPTKDSRDFAVLEFDFPIDSPQQAYKIIVNYKNNMVFL